MEVGEYIESQRPMPRAAFDGTEDYLVIPRSVLQSMPRHWQLWFCTLLQMMDNTVAWSRGYGYRAHRVDAEGRDQKQDPYREWKRGEKLRRVLHWWEVKGFRMLHGALMPTDRPTEIGEYVTEPSDVRAVVREPRGPEYEYETKRLGEIRYPEPRQGFFGIEVKSDAALPAHVSVMMNQSDRPSSVVVHCVERLEFHELVEIVSYLVVKGAGRGTQVNFVGPE